MVELKYFERSDFNQLIEWIDSPEFLLQWGGPGFDYPLNDAQLENISKTQIIITQKR